MQSKLREIRVHPRFAVEQGLKSASVFVAIMCLISLPLCVYLQGRWEDEDKAGRSFLLVKCSHSVEKEDKAKQCEWDDRGTGSDQA